MSSSASTQSAPEIDGAWPIYRRLLRYAKPFWPVLALALVAMMLEAAAAGAFTALMEPVIDETFIEKNRGTSLWLPAAILGIFLVRGVATWVTDTGMARVGRGVVRQLREELMGKFLAMPSSFFDRESPARLSSRITFHTEQVAQASSESIKVAVVDSLTILVLLAVMLDKSVKLTLAMLFVGPLIAALIAVVGRRYRRINSSIQDSVAEMAQVGTQALAAQQEVKLYGARAQEIARFARIADANRKLNIKVEATRALSSSLVQILAAIALAIILLIAGQEAVKGRLEAGEFVAFMFAMMALLPSLKRITNVQSLIQKGVAAATGLFELLDAEDERDTGTRMLARAAGRIEFRDVSARYGEAVDDALSEVSFRAEPGTVTAIVGRSGSGKSTLMRLLPRFYEPSQGEVHLDGVAVTDYRLAELRRQIAMVGQDVTLLDDSIAQNIAYGAAGPIDEERVRAAAISANAMEFIERLPGGLDARIGTDGGLLSGGQRQRLAIARALYKNAPILILDEATSALDSESERLVQDALERIMHDRTTLVIAHRLSTIEHADQVLVLEQGRIVEQGTHAQLLAAAGVYARLHGMQFRETPDAIPGPAG